MISIIGSGRVGSAIAFLCASESLDDVTLLNRTRSKAIGEAMDISNAISPTSDIMIKGTDDYSDIRDSNLVVISASAANYQKSRLDVIHEQASMINDIGKKIMKYCPSATILMITNPLDVLTYVFQKNTQIPKNKVIGVAASLDSSRFLYLLSTKLGIKRTKITNAIVIGEHGDSMVPVYSNIKIEGKNISNLLNNQEKESITNEVRTYWKSLRNYKSRSQFGIAKNTYDIIKTITIDSITEAPASVVLDGEYGLKNLAIGVPVKISKNGIEEIQDINLDENESRLFKQSAKIIQTNISSLKK
ncbi:MAG: lactate dehydrogenase [Nitrosopumilaceae archaeon]|nr:lactate dehydrogenase [Nitrosopumilaceae archaeon]